MLAPSKPPSYRHQRHGTRTHARGHQESKSIKHACIETVATKTTRERPHASKKLHISAISTIKPHMKPFNHNIGHTPPTKHLHGQDEVRMLHHAQPSTSKHNQARLCTKEPNGTRHGACQPQSRHHRTNTNNMGHERMHEDTMYQRTSRTNAKRPYQPKQHAEDHMQATSPSQVPHAPTNHT